MSILHRLTPRPAALLLGLAAALSLGSAHAQRVGNYVGTTSQGQSFQLSVADDGNGGLLLTALGANYQTTCKTGDNKSFGWYIGPWTPIVGGRTQVAFNQSFLVEQATVRFSADGTSAKGMFLARVPTFVDANTNTRAVELCDTGSLTFSVDYQWPTAAAQGEAVPAPGKGQALPR